MQHDEGLSPGSRKGRRERMLNEFSLVSAGGLLVNLSALYLLADRAGLAVEEMQPSTVLTLVRLLCFRDGDASSCCSALECM